MTQERGNAFDLDGLDDFAPKPPAAPGGGNDKAVAAVVDQVAKANGFPSRDAKIVATNPAMPDRPGLESWQGKDRRVRTGRNQQLPIKTTVEHKAMFYKVVDEHHFGLGECFENAIELYVKALEIGKQAGMTPAQVVDKILGV